MSQYVKNFVDDIRSVMVEIASASSTHVDTALVITPHINSGLGSHHTAINLKETIVQALQHIFYSHLVDIATGSAKQCVKKLISESKDFDDLFDITCYQDKAVAEIYCSKVQQTISLLVFVDHVLMSLMSYKRAHPSTIFTLRTVTHKDLQVNDLIIKPQFLDLFEFYSWRAHSVRVKMENVTSVAHKVVEIDLETILTA